MRATARPFVGRTAELNLLAERLRQAADGRPQIVLIDGPPGIGKTALVQRFLETSATVRVMVASGEESESELAYGALEQLLDRADVARPPALLGLADARPRDPLAVGAALLEVLGQVEAAGPVVICLDDVHWADRPSLQALTFALRRLRADAVLTIVCCREEWTAQMPSSLEGIISGERGTHLRLAGLSTREIRELGGELGVDLPAGTAQRLQEHTAGSPLHARALLEELPPTLLRASPNLPAPRSYRDVLLARVDALPADAGRLLAAAAVLGNRSPLSLVVSLAEIDEPLPALDAACKARIVELQEGTVERTVVFTHPLARAAVYHRLGSAERAGLHARAAARMPGTAARLRHRADAVPGHDADLAAQVAAFAEAEIARGAYSSAAAQLVTAARLSPTPRDREQRLLEAVECLLRTGDVAQTTGYLPDLAGFPDTPRRAQVLGHLAMVQGRQRDAVDLLSRAWDQVDTRRDPELAARVAGQLATLHINWADSTTALSWARRALELSPATAGHSDAAAIELLSLGVCGRAEEGLAQVQLPDPMPRPGLGQVTRLAGRGVLRLWNDDLEGASRDLAAVFDACRATGPFHLAVVALQYLADAEYRRGAWDDAIVHGELAVSTAEDADQTWQAALVHAVVAFPLAARGDETRAEQHIEIAEAAAATLGDAASILWAAVARARLAAARGEPSQVVGALQPVLDRDLTAMDQPGIQPWRSLLADARRQLDELDEAEAVLAPLEDLARQRQHRSTLVNVGRVRAGLAAARGRTDEAESAFRTALDHAADLHMPFDRALLEHAYGLFLRQHGERRAATTLLRVADDRFTQLGARPYAARCEQALAGHRPSSGKRRVRHSTDLTPGEHAVAHLVASGLTNREVAAELVVSVKTVEYHLGNIYNKLGVSSRSQLLLHLRSTPSSTEPR